MKAGALPCPPLPQAALTCLGDASLSPAHKGHVGVVPGTGTLSVSQSDYLSVPIARNPGMSPDTQLLC